MQRNSTKIISYAQNAEDIVLQRALSQVDEGFYVDIGAWHPINESVTKVFYDRGWQGINIEPQAKHIEYFYKERPRDINLQLAISNNPGQIALWIPKYSALATCCTELLDSKIPDYSNPEKHQVPALRLEQILTEHAKNKTIHFLKVDVEGYETSVLYSNNFEVHRPLVLVIEAVSPRTGEPTWHLWEPFLLSKGYIFALFDGLNRFYVREESRTLLPKLAIPANCLDGYITLREWKIERELAATIKRIG